TSRARRRASWGEAARDDATRAFVGPPPVGTGLADPATNDATRAFVGPPPVGTGLAERATNDATGAFVGPPPVGTGLPDPATNDARRRPAPAGHDAHALSDANLGEGRVCDQGGAGSGDPRRGGARA